MVLLYMDIKKMDEEIFKISSNKVMSLSLIEMAKERLQDISKESKPYKIIEQYYEIIKELITSIMYSNGFKTLSHKALVDYIRTNYKELSPADVFLIDELRKLKNNILYYGQKDEKEFLINHETHIRSIISKLTKLAEKES